MARSKHVAVASTLAAAVLWGTSFGVNDAGLHSVTPITFVVLRFALAGAVTLAAAAILRALDARVLRRPLFWGLAVANAGGFLLQYYGQTITTPARTALFVNVSAFAVALLERFVLGRRLGWPRVAAVVVGTIGASILVVGADPRAALQGGRLTGDLLALGSGLAWSVYLLMNQRALRDDASPLNVTGWTFALTALVTAPLLLFADPAPLAVPPAGAIAVLYAGLATTALAYGLWSWGLRELRPSASALLLLVEILVASLVSLAIGRETFGPVEIVGAALLVGAVVGMSVVEERADGA